MEVDIENCIDVVSRKRRIGVDAACQCRSISKEKLLHTQRKVQNNTYNTKRSLRISSQPHAPNGLNHLCDHRLS